jgi:hypothetical protein
LDSPFISGITEVSSLIVAIAGAVGVLKHILGQLEKRSAKVDGFKLIQDVLLLYKPLTRRAWIPHILFWVLAVVTPFVLIEVAEDESRSHKALWDFFFIGLLVMVWLWGAAERKRKLQNQTPVPVAAILYAWVGISALVGGFFLLANRDFSGGARLVSFGVIVTGCAYTLAMWSKLTAHVPSLDKHKATLLLLPPLLLALTFILNAGGIVENEFRGDFVGYWRSWIANPFIPLLFFPFAALPLYAGITCLNRTTPIQKRGRFS